MWLNLVKEKIEYCFLKNKIPIVVGGTGMYISKLINGISQIPETPVEIRNKVLDFYNNNGLEECYQKALKIDSEYIKKIDKNNNIHINNRQRLERYITYYNQTGNGKIYRFSA